MQSTLCRLSVPAVLLVFASLISAQVAVGNYPYGTYDNKGFDTINVGNLNTLVAIPIINKSGRGMNFFYNLVYNSSVWSPVNSSGQSTWTPAQQFGWQANTEALTGYVTFDVDANLVPVPNHHGLQCVNYEYYNFVYSDTFGVIHPYSVATWDDSDCISYGLHYTSQPNASATATDGSGFTLSITGFVDATVSSPSGKLVNPSGGSGYYGVVTDPNGNSITTNGGGIFKDTLGLQVLAVAGNAPSPTTFTYTDTHGGPQSATIYYTPYTVQTSFGCSLVSEYGPLQNYLVDHIAFPDGQTYSFQYETTPGHPSNTTGRVSQVTLPTGGRIQYAYGGANNGVNCADGGALILTRTMPDDSAGSTHSIYTRTPGSGTSHTEVQDGNGNHIAYDFVTGTLGAFNALYESQRKQYQQTESGTPTLLRQSCYNGATLPCTTTTIAFPIVSMSTYETWDGTQERGSDFHYNSYGLVTEKDDYDFGSSTRGGLLQKTAYSYPTSGVISNPKSIVTYDGAGDILSGYFFLYDPYGNLSSSYISESSSQAQSGAGIQVASYTYDTHGQRKTFADQSGNQTSITYDATYGAYPITVTHPAVAGVQHVSHFAWDYNTGLMLSSTDENGNLSTFTYDNMLRPLLSSYPDTGQSTMSYSLTANPPTSSLSILHSVGGSNIVQTTTFDPYSRTKNMSHTDSPSNDLIDYAYDGNGNLASVSNPYRSTGDQTYGVTRYTYDSLGRLLQITRQDGVSKASYSYLANTIGVTDEAGNQRSTTVDGLSRITQLLEPDSTGSLAVNTNYLYNQAYASGTVNGRPQSSYQFIVQQKGGSTNSALWRVRTFTYDLYSRIVKEQTPETSNLGSSMAYQFNTTSGSYCSGDPQMPCYRIDPRGVTTTYVYDALNRLTGKSYSTTTPATPAVSYYYDQSSFNGLTITNPIGQRTGMSDGSGSTAWGFDTMGRIVKIERTINSVSKQAAYGYNTDGTLASLQDFSGSTVSYSYNSAGRPISAVDSAHALNFATGGGFAAPGLLTNMIQGNASGFAGITTSNQFNQLMEPAALSSSTPTGTVFSLSYGFGTSGHNNGNIQQITNNLNSALSQTFGYDHMNRLTSAQAGNTWGNTYVYDAWSNLLQKNQISGTAQGESLSVGVNPYNQITGVGYDAAGDVTLDNKGNALKYDGENRISTVSGETYLYDGDGIRVEKSGSSVNRLYWPDIGGKTLNETDLSGNTMVRNAYYVGELIARVDAAGNVHYPVYDHLGSARAVFSSSGVVQDQIDYYPFGTILNYSTQTSGDSYTFTGYESDAESSSYHAWFRNQSPSLGRFLSSDPDDGSYDPSSPQSFNRYSYVQNSPITYVDLFGLWLQFECKTVEKPVTAANGDSGVNSTTVCTYWDDGGGELNESIAYQNLALLTGFSSPNSPTSKSPARKQCEANAAGKYNAAKSAASNGFGKGFVATVVIIGAVNFGTGCAVGAGASVAAVNFFTDFVGSVFSWPAGEVGCAIGGGDAVLNGLFPSAMGGAVVGGGVYLWDLSDAKSGLQQDMQACGKL